MGHQLNNDMYQAIIFTDVTDNIVVAPSIGAFKCAHMLRKNGYSCLVVGHLSEYSLDELKELLAVVLSQHTVLVGFSRTFFKNIEITVTPGQPTPAYPPILHSDMFPQGKQFENEIFKFIKSIAKNSKIVAGGNITSSRNISNRNVDYVCLGYSELAIVALVDHLVKGTELKGQSKNIHGRILIDGAQTPGYEFAQEDMIWHDTDVVNHRTLPVEIGRGCIFKCKFCSYPLNGKKNLDYVKSAENLYTELLANYEKFGVEQYLIIDDTFNDHPDKLEMVRSAIKRLPFTPRFWAYIRLDLLCTRPDSVDTLYDIGVRGFYFGIETLNLETGRFIGKGYDKKKQIATVRRIKEKYKDSVCLHGSFIVGLPKESLEQVNETFDLLRSGELPLDSWSMNGLQITKVAENVFTSDIDRNYLSYGYIDTGTPANQAKINWVNEHMTSDVANKIARDFMVSTEGHIKIPAHTAFNLATYDLDLDQLMIANHKTFNWNHIECQVKPKFIQHYKTTLLELVKNKSVSSTIG